MSRATPAVLIALKAGVLLPKVTDELAIGRCVMNTYQRRPATSVVSLVIALALVCGACSNTEEITGSTTCAEYLGYDNDARGQAVRTLGVAAGWTDAGNPMSILSFDSHCSQRPTQTLDQAIGLFASSASSNDEAAEAPTDEEASIDASLGRSVCDETAGDRGLIGEEFLSQDLTVGAFFDLVDALVESNDEPAALLDDLAEIESSFDEISYESGDRFYEVVGRLRFAGVETSSAFTAIDRLAERDCGFAIFGTTATERIQNLSPAPTADSGATVDPEQLYREECYWTGEMIPPQQTVYKCTDENSSRFALVDLVTGDIVGRAHVPEPENGLYERVFFSSWGIGYMHWVHQPPSGLDLGTETLTLVRSEWDGQSESLELTEPLPRADTDPSLRVELVGSSAYGTAATYTSPESGAMILAFLNPNGDIASEIDLGEQDRYGGWEWDEPLTNRIVFVGDYMADLANSDLVRNAAGDPIEVAYREFASDACLGSAVLENYYDVDTLLVEQPGTIEVTELPLIGNPVVPTAAGVVAAADLFLSQGDVSGYDATGSLLWTISNDIAKGFGEAGGRLFILNPASEWIPVDPATGLEATSDPETAFLSEYVEGAGTGGSNSQRFRPTRDPETGELMISYVSDFVFGAGVQEYTVLIRPSNYCQP